MTAVGDPPRPAPAARPALGQFVRATTTPAKLRLLLVGLVSLCLIWGGVAAWVVSQRASGANDVVGTSEPLSLDGQQIYRALSDADATAASAFLSGGLEPLAARRRYQADIAQAAAHLESATAAAGHSPAARNLATLSAGLPVYTGEVETARADNRLGLPLGAAYLREASGLMRGTLLPAARDVSAQANGQLSVASGRATGLPLALVLLVAAAAVGYVLYRAQRWLFSRTHRILSPGLVVASVAAVVSLLWLVIAVGVARADLLQARAHGSAPVAALAQADIAALRAHADESLTLIDAGGDDSFQADFKAVQHQLGPGSGTLLTDAVTAARGSPGAGSAAAAATTATAWYAAHRTVRFLDDNGKHTQAVRLAATPGPGHSGTLFARLDSSLTGAIAAEQVVFRSSAVAGRDAFTGLEAGVIVLSLIMAVGCARGLSRRLAEYR
ncbi:MAG TPA: hypothetical protein VIJ82_09845 [Streptosporangiaceae bacterium]